MTSPAEQGESADEATSSRDTRLLGAGGFPPLVALYGRIVGKRRHGEYVERFLRFDRVPAHRRASWCWPAALVTVAWMLYRRMPLWALLGYPLVTLGLLLLTLVLVSAVTGGNPPEPLAGILLVAIAIVWPGLAGRALYHRRARRLIARMETRFAAEPRAGVEWLAGRGGVSRLGAAAGVVLTVVPAVLLVLSSAHDPGAPVTDAERRAARVEQLLAGAREDFDALRLSTPPGDNALEQVREALALEPDNEDALAAQRAIVDKYVELGAVAMGRGDLDDARLYLERALRVAPGDPRLEQYRQELERRGRARSGG